MATKATIIENIIASNLIYNLPYQGDAYIECTIDSSGYIRVPLVFIPLLQPRVYIGDKKYLAFSVNNWSSNTSRLAWKKYFSSAFPEEKGLSTGAIERINTYGKDVIHYMRGLVFDEYNNLQIALYARYKVIDGVIDTSEYVLGYFQKRELDLSTDFITRGFGKIKKNIFADSYGEGDYPIVEVTDNPKYIRYRRIPTLETLTRSDIMKDNIIKLKANTKKYVQENV